MDCFISKDSCKKGNTEECGENCKAYILFDAIYRGSKVPKMYQRDTQLIPCNRDLANFRKLNNYKLNILDNVLHSNHLFIYSDGTGNGKTTWTSKILLEYAKKQVVNLKFEDVFYFVNVPEFLEDLRRGYEGGEYDDILNKLRVCDIVVFDDLGAERVTDWVRERLYSIINNRIQNEKLCIFTSNNSIDSLEGILGSRICSRLNLCEQIELVGKDNRRGGN